MSTFYCPVGNRVWFTLWPGKIDLGFHKERGFDNLFLFGLWLRKENGKWHRRGK